MVGVWRRDRYRLALGFRSFTSTSPRPRAARRSVPRQEFDRRRKVEGSRELKSKDAKDEDLKREFAVVNDLRHDLATRRFEMDLKVRQAIGPDRIHIFDPMGPPPGMHGGHHGPGGPRDHHGPPGPPPLDEREHDRDER